MANVKLGKRLKSKVFEAVFGDSKRCCETLRECYTPKSLDYSEHCSPVHAPFCYDSILDQTPSGPKEKSFEWVILLTVKANSRKYIE